MSWNELNDPRRAGPPRTFYGAVFGWDFEDNDMGGMGTYTGIRLDGTRSAG